MADTAVVCVKCKATSSLLWQKNQIGALLCRDCYSQERRTRSSRSPQRIASTTTASTSTTETTNSMTSSSCATTTNQQAQSQSSEKSSTSKYQTSSVSTRRTTRSRERNNRAKQQQQQQQKEVQQVQNVASASMSTPPSPATSTNGVSVKEKVNSKPLSNGTHDRDTSNGEDGQQKGRRSLKLKQGQPTKAPSPEVMIVTSDSIIHKGTTYEVGDIVSLLDRDGGIYYAMIRGFMQDQYAEKYAVLTWLLPRYPNPTHFDPSDFILGPEEDIPRSMEVIDFVSHSPQSRHFQTSYFHNLEQAELWKH